MAWDDVAGKAAGNNGDKYVVVLGCFNRKTTWHWFRHSKVLLICNHCEINKQARISTNIFWL